MGHEHCAVQKNFKFYIPGHQNEGENAKAHAKISVIVNKNTVGLDGPLADAIQTRFGAICSLLRARRGFRMWGKMGGRKVKRKDFSRHKNQVQRYSPNDHKMAGFLMEHLL